MPEFFALTVLPFLKRFWPYIVGLIVLVIVVVLIFNAGAKHETAKTDQRTIQVQQKVGNANDKAAETRVTDQKKLDHDIQENHDAITNASNGDDARRRAGCAIMRQQGRNTSNIPACR